jgi:hypothetical protein
MTNATMETMTFLFVTNDPTLRWNKSVVTAETKEECVEKYFLKYPERRGSDEVQVFDGDREDITFSMVPTEPETPDNKLVPRSAILFEDKGSFLLDDNRLAKLTLDSAIDFQAELARLVNDNRQYDFEVLDDPKGIRITWEKKNAG